MAEHVLLQPLKVMIFLLFFVRVMPRAYAKEKKTRDSSGCFISCEMASLLQDSTGKERMVPPFQTLATTPFPPF
jgi:hypothetical protein